MSAMRMRLVVPFIPKGMPAMMTTAEFQEMCETSVPIVAGYGVKVDRMQWGRVRLRLPFDEKFVRPGGTISGPVMMALGDMCMYGVVLSCIGRVELAVTTNLTCNFLRKPAPKDLHVDGRILKLGKRLAYGEVTLYSDGEEDDPVAHVTATYSIPPDR